MKCFVNLYDIYFDAIDAHRNLQAVSERSV